MIELLIKYIQDKGYKVRVMPNVLLIQKEAKGQIFGVDWAISQFDLHPDFEQYLYDGADKRLELIDEAIRAYKEPA
jgi:hypothetical protein